MLHEENCRCHMSCNMFLNWKTVLLPPTDGHIFGEKNRSVSHHPPSISIYFEDLFNFMAQRWLAYSVRGFHKTFRNRRWAVCFRVTDQVIFSYSLKQGRYLNPSKNYSFIYALPFENLKGWNSQEYHHLVSNGETNRPVEKGLFEAFRKHTNSLSVLASLFSDSHVSYLQYVIREV